MSGRIWIRKKNWSHISVRRFSQNRIQIRLKSAWIWSIQLRIRSTSIRIRSILIRIRSISIRIRSISIRIRNPGCFTTYHPCTGQRNNGGPRGLKCSPLGYHLLRVFSITNGKKRVSFLWRDVIALNLYASAEFMAGVGSPKCEKLFGLSVDIFRGFCCEILLPLILQLAPLAEIYRQQCLIGRAQPMKMNFSLYFLVKI